MMKAGRVLSFIVFTIFLVNPVFSQIYRISGKVTDKKSGDAIMNAMVSVKGELDYVTTSEMGYFYMNVPSDTCIITVRYEEFETVEIQLNPEMIKKKIDVSLGYSDEYIEEVVITGQKENVLTEKSNVVSTVSISPQLIKKLPNFGETDIMRSFQLLPGVSGSNETSAGLYVRGGTPDQNLILFDGMTIYHVDHFYGFFSAFNANSVDDAELYKGGFPAKFGGRISSVLELKAKPASMNEYKFGGGISLLSLNAFAEVPIVKNKLSAQLSIRRSYTDFLRSGLYDKINSMYNSSDDEYGRGSREVPGGRMGIERETFQPDFYFYDLNSKITYRQSEKNIFTVSFYNGQDNLDNSREQNFGMSDDNSIEITDVLKWGNIGSTAGWVRLWNKKFQTNTSVSYSNYFSLSDRSNDMQSGGAPNIRDVNTYEDNKVKAVNARCENKWFITENNTVEFGAQITYNDISYQNIRNDTFEIMNIQDYGTQYSLYLQDDFDVFKILHLNGGIRATYYDITDKMYYEPRLSAILNLPFDFKLKGATGLYYQFINRTVREDILSGSKDFWLMSDDVNIPVSSAVHYIAGIEKEMGQYLFTAEYFHKDLSGLSEFSMRYARTFMNFQPEELFFTGTGFVNGLELSAQKRMGKVTGWLAYTYSQVIYNFPDINNGESFYASHDQPHEFKAVVTYQVGRFDFSSTFIFASGTPYTAPDGLYELTLLDGTDFTYIHVSDKNAYRLPDYHRMDVSATMNFKLWKTKADINLSIFNFYDHKNVWYKEFNTNEESGELVETDVTKLGFTPNISFHIYFNKKMK